jgi:hypothetical protein
MKDAATPTHVLFHGSFSVMARHTIMVLELITTTVISHLLAQ